MSFRKKSFTYRIALAIALVSIFSIIAAQTETFFHLEELSLDYRYRKFNPELAVSDKIVLIDIDEQSLKHLENRYGRWPWPRSVYKEALQFLAQGEPAIMLFDILFPERDLNSPQKDEEFVEITAATQTSHAVQFLKESSTFGQEHMSLIPKLKEQTFEMPNVRFENWPEDLQFNDFSVPFKNLLDASSFLHSVNTSKQSDGVIRQMPLFIQYDHRWLPSLSMRALLSGLKKPKFNLIDDHLLVYDNEDLKWKIPLLKNGTFAPHFYSLNNRPTIYRFAEVIDSASQVLQGNLDNLSVDPLTLKDKIVIFGASATGLADLKTTPLAENEPGVLLHTTVISNILQNHNQVRLPQYMGWIFTIILLFLIYGLMFFTRNLIIRSTAPLMIAATYVLISFYLFKNYSLAIPMAAPLLATLIALLDGFIYMSFVEGKDKRRLTSTLSKYLSPEVTKSLIEHGIDPTAEVGHTQELSILFSDIRGFTTMSESMEPSLVVTILNQYLGKMTDIVFKHQGTLDKFIGDAVMAFWGAPIIDKDHAKNAILTAFEMVAELDHLNRSWKAKSWPELKIGIGIQTGNVIVGNIGSDRRLDYTVIGDTVNLTSRLESLTKFYGINIVVGQSCYDQTKEYFKFRPIDRVQVKGKSNSILIWQPLMQVSDNISEKDKLIHQFTRGFELYSSGHFRDALDLFLEIQKVFPDDEPTRLYIDRCLDLIENKPISWSGVYIAKSK